MSKENNAKVKKYHLQFKDEVRTAILSDAILLNSLANSTGKSVGAVITMFYRNSQTLMHISLQEEISKRLKIETSKLTSKLSAK